MTRAFILTMRGRRTEEFLHTFYRPAQLCCFTVVGVIYSSIANAQMTDNPYRFEVSSVKSSEQGVDAHVERTASDPGLFSVNNVPLATLLLRAYHLAPYQLIAPSWLTSAPYDILAKAPAASTFQQQSMMLQNLLADRFGLKVHREKREMPVDVLTVAKDGPKFKEFVPPPPGERHSSPTASANAVTDPDGYPALPPEGGTSWIAGKGGVMREHITMDVLARKIAALIGQPITAMGTRLKPGGSGFRRSASPVSDRRTRQRRRAGGRAEIATRAQT
jgi:uncharacterized protein (TIGR03435 family)